MAVAEPNRVVAALMEVCRRAPVAEKWLLAPSVTVARQWQEWAARAGAAVVNMHPVSVGRLARSLAEPVMRSRGLVPMPRGAGEFLVGALWPAGRGEYLGRVRRSGRLLRAMARTMGDLRRVRLAGEPLDVGAFEAPAKGRDLLALLGDYEVALKARGWVDPPGLLQLAREAVTGGGWPAGRLLLVPEDLALGALETELVGAVPAEALRRLPVDEAAAGGGGRVEWRAACGEVNEVRGVLRRILAQERSLDEVEILYTAADPYVGLIHDTLQARLAAGGRVPATFAEGLPAAASRPARALQGWLAWRRDQVFAQAPLAALLGEGLLVVRGDGAEEGGAGLAAALRSVGVGAGRERYGAVLGEAAAGFRGRAACEGKAGRAAALRRRAMTLEALGRVVRALLELTPEAGASSGEVLEAAATFLEQWTVAAGPLDATARRVFVREVRSVAELAGLDPAFDAWAWLEELPGRVRVEPRGPRPGCVHVAPLSSGGHAGRLLTVVMGMDDGRFPGGGAQDPLLLDAERSRVGGGVLEPGAARVTEREAAFGRLRSWLRGELLLTYPKVGAVEDRELLPATVLVGLHRQRSGDGSADLSAFLAALPPAWGTAPSSGEGVLDETDWWLGLVGSGVDGAEALGARYPLLGRGAVAAAARESEAVTAWDGFVGPVSELDPTAEGGPVVSASALERMGRCPLAYFFHDVLKLRPPDEVGGSAGRWLEPSEVGSLLHEVFCSFMRRVAARGERPSVERHGGELEGVVDERVFAWRHQVPPADEALFQARYEELQRVARIFLAEEEVHCREAEPRFFEVAVGMEAEGEGTLLDCIEPVAFPLPGGGRVLVRGRVDRVDALGENGRGGWMIWDYKTGSPAGHGGRDPFDGGRRVQHVLYRVVVEGRLRACVDSTARVAGVGYFFPHPRGMGLRIAYDPGTLDRGAAVIESLVGKARDGIFLATTDAGRDCRYCDFRRICLPVEETAARSARKQGVLP